MSGFTRRDLVLGGGTLAASLTVSALGRTVNGAPSRVLNSFKPGRPWLDTSGNPIQAHGGAVIVVGDRFYWYGSDHSKAAPHSDRMSEGVRLYESTDLYNWRDLGLIIETSASDSESPLPASRWLCRPHILRCPNSGKFVCWLYVTGLDDDGRSPHIALTAERITGPYTVVGSFQPLGYSCGDFDLVPDLASGKAWQILNRGHADVFVAELTPEYTAFNGNYSWHLSKSGPPLAREAPAHFFRNGKHYLTTSGTTGWHPNPSEVAWAPEINGPWQVLGDLHPSDQSRTSLNSQLSSIFKHPNKQDLYIALADRWVTNLPNIAGSSLTDGTAYWRAARIFTTLFSQGYAALNDKDKRYFDQTTGNEYDLSSAGYVWLPVRLVGDRPVIDWRDEWSLDEFA